VKTVLLSASFISPSPLLCDLRPVPSPSPSFAAFADVTNAIKTREQKEEELLKIENGNTVLGGNILRLFKQDEAARYAAHSRDGVASLFFYFFRSKIRLNILFLNLPTVPDISHVHFLFSAWSRLPLGLSRTAPLVLSFAFLPLVFVPDPALLPLHPPHRTAPAAARFGVCRQAFHAFVEVQRVYVRDASALVAALTERVAAVNPVADGQVCVCGFNVV
jgi:hypothetical protein